MQGSRYIQGEAEVGDGSWLLTEPQQFERNRSSLVGKFGVSRMMMLFNFVEDPPYGCPLSRDEDPSTREIPLKTNDIGKDDMVCQMPLDPATYCGLTWVGRIAEVSMEVWVRGADKKARQKGAA